MSETSTLFMNRVVPPEGGQFANGESGGGSGGTQSGKSIHVFHGTSSKAWERIKKEGLVPHGDKGADSWAKEFMSETFVTPDRELSVFVTPDISRAHVYAEMATEMTESKKPVLMAIDIPADEYHNNLVRDEKDPLAYRYRGARTGPSVSPTKTARCGHGMVMWNSRR